MVLKLKDKVEKAIAQLQEQLGTTFVYLVNQIESHVDEDGDFTEEPFFTIRRSERDKEDKAIYIVEYSKRNLEKLSMVEIKRHFFHELLHSMLWDLSDEADYALSHVRNKKLAEELNRRYSHINENTVYKLERTFGPFVLPKVDWTKP